MPNQSPAKTISELSARIDAVNARIDNLLEKHNLSEATTRDALSSMKKEMQDMDDQITENMVVIGRLGERITMYQALQAGFSTIAASVAAVVATVFKR